MKTRPPLRERRSADRPSNGDTRSCPNCSAGILEFSERYRIALADGRTIVIPAWACDQCRHVRAARHGDRRRLAVPKM
jgi:YgiT-type zinc finger domain-containing protein